MRTKYAIVGCLACVAAWAVVLSVASHPGAAGHQAALARTALSHEEMTKVRGGATIQHFVCVNICPYYSGLCDESETCFKEEECESMNIPEPLVVYQCVCRTDETCDEYLVPIILKNCGDAIKCFCNTLIFKCRKRDSPNYLLQETC